LENQGNLIYQDNMGVHSNPCSYQSGDSYPFSEFIDDPEHPIFNVAKNKALRKWDDKISENANWLLNLAEYKQAASLLSQRISQILEIFVAIKKRDLGEIWDAVSNAYDQRSLSYQRARRQYTKTRRVLKKYQNVGDAWLSWHFGVSPLIADCQSTMKILQMDHEHLPILVKASSRPPSTGWTTRYSNRVGTLVTQGYETSKVTRSVRVSIGGSIRIVNPNLFLAEQLGFTNPFVIGFELVRFSFFADWVSNMSQWIKSFVPNLAVEVHSPYYTVVCRRICSYTKGDELIWDDGSDNESAHGSVVSKQVYLERKLGHPEVTLQFKLPARLSLSRGATAIAILLQQIKGVKA
jgi:hypothetical protein